MKPSQYFLISFIALQSLLQVKLCQAQDTLRLYSLAALKSYSVNELKQELAGTEAIFSRSASCVDSMALADRTIFYNYTYIYLLMNRFLLSTRLRGQEPAFHQLLAERGRIAKVADQFRALHHLSYNIPYNMIADALKGEGFHDYAVRFLENTWINNTKRGEPDTAFIETLYLYACETGELGRHAQKAKLLEQAVDLSKRKAYVDLYIECQEMLATTYRVMGEFRKSKEAYQDLFHQLGADNQNTLKFAHALQTYSDLLSNLGDMEGALHCLRKAREIIIKITQPGSLAHAIITAHLMKAYLEHGDFQEAERLFVKEQEQVKTGYRQSPDRYATFLGNASNLYLSLKNTSKAISLAQQSMAIVQQLPEIEKKRELAGTFNQLALSYSASHHAQDLEKAEQSFDDCLTAGAAYPGQSSMFYAEYLSNAFEFKWKHHDITQKDLSNLARATQIFNAHYSDNIGGLTDLRPRVIKEHFSRNNNLLLSMCMLIDNDSLNKAAFDNQIAFKNSLLRSAQSNMQHNRNITFQDLKRQLKPGEAFINFIQFDYVQKGLKTGEKRYAAFVIHPNSKVPKFIALFSEQELSVEIMHGKKLKEPREIYLTPADFNRGTISPDRFKLTNLIWHNLWPLLPSGTRKIYYLSDGLLNILSMPALARKEGFLIDSFEFMPLVDAASLSLPAGNPVIKGAALFGGIKYNTKAQETARDYSGYFEEQHEMLQLSRDIAKTVSRNGISIDTFIGHNATEQAFYKIADKNTDLLLAFTHGFYNDLNPKATEKSFIFSSPYSTDRCGIALADANDAIKKKTTSSPEDGLLIGEEIMNMNLNKTALVVLGACKSGVGPIETGEGIWGLQRAFKIAGVRYLLVSTSDVRTDYTVKFLTAFLDRLMSKNNPGIESVFIQTQKAFKDSDPDQIEWSHWILIK